MTHQYYEGLAATCRSFCYLLIFLVIEQTAVRHMEIEKYIYDDAGDAGDVV